MNKYLEKIAKTLSNEEFLRVTDQEDEDTRKKYMAEIGKLVEPNKPSYAVRGSLDAATIGSIASTVLLSKLQPHSKIIPLLGTAASLGLGTASVIAHNIGNKQDRNYDKEYRKYVDRGNKIYEKYYGY